MSVISKFFDWVFGNGVDRQQIETEIQHQKARTQNCHDNTLHNFHRLNEAFDELDLGESPGDSESAYFDRGGDHGYQC